MAHLFTVYQNKIPMMSTDHVECIYDKATLKRMAEAGFKFKLNGRVASIYDVINYVKEHSNK